jgi:3'-phosphoadenosine 5'-phosphosulfate sulfotransferase (PAPS reductase)/FAD synthetase
MKTYISFSGGVESTTMCLLYGKDATAIWVDTGAEHKEMYERIDYTEQKLKEYHNGKFELIRLKGNAKYKGNYYQSLEDYIVAIRFMPSQQRRFCTIEFKIKPIDEFLSKEECELLIGFNYDEQGRTGNLEKKSNIRYRYPLIEDGLTRDDCEEILKINNLHPRFPVYMLRGGCRMCFFKSEKEYRAMYHLNRPEFYEVMKFEEEIQDKREKFYSIMGNGKSLRQLAQECETELFNDKSLYDDYKKDGKSCGAFCRR